MNAASIRQAMWLTSHGVPFDVAFSMDEEMRTGLSIICSEQDTGRRFNFDSMKFEE